MPSSLISCCLSSLSRVLGEKVQKQWQATATYNPSTIGQRDLEVVGSCWSPASLLCKRSHLRGIKWKMIEQMRAYTQKRFKNIFFNLMTLSNTEQSFSLVKHAMQHMLKFEALQ